jgi:G6PDH family F420-dependent oxidoreductase
MLEEAVDVIKKLWAGGTVEHFGRYYTIDNARIYSRPTEPPAIVVAAAAENAAAAAARIGDGLLTVSPSPELVQAFEEAGGKGKPRYGQLDVCAAEDEAEARRVARAQWSAPAAIPPRLLARLRVPADFRAVADLVSEERVTERVLCSADPERHVARIDEFVRAGFDHIHVHQVGPDQETFFRFYEREVLPRARDL